METCLEFSILKIEGVEFDLVHIWEEGYPETTLKPHNLKQHITLTGDKEITIDIQGPNDQGRVSFLTSALPSEGLQYLPLYEDRVLDSIPEDVVSPRVLICIISKIEYKEPVPEIKLFDNENSKDLQCKVIDLEHLLKKKEQEYQNEIVSLKSQSSTQRGQQEIEMEKLLMQVKRQRVLLNEYEDNLKMLKEMLDSERSLRESQDSRLISMSQQYQDSLQRSKQRESELLKIINEKEKELRMAVSELSELRSENQTLLWQRNRVSEEASRLEVELSTVSLSEFKEEVLFLKEELIRSEQQREELAIRLKELEAEWDSCIGNSAGNGRDYTLELDELKECFNKKEQEFDVLRRDYEDLLCCLETTGGVSKPVEEVYLQYSQAKAYSEELEQKLNSSELEIQYLNQQIEIYKHKLKEEISHSDKLEDTYNSEKQLNFTLQTTIESLKNKLDDLEVANLQEKQKREMLEVQYNKEKASNEKIKEMLDILRKEKEQLEIALCQEKAKLKVLDNNLTTEKAKNKRLEQFVEDDKKYKEPATKTDKVAKGSSIELDRKVQGILKKEGYEGILIKIGDGLYLHSRQRIKLSLENGIVMCRYGNKSATLEEYLAENAPGSAESTRRQYTPRNNTPPRTMHRRMQTFSGLSPDDIKEKIGMSLLEESVLLPKPRNSLNLLAEEAKINEVSVIHKREKVAHPVLRTTRTQGRSPLKERESKKNSQSMENLHTGK